MENAAYLLIGIACGFMIAYGAVSQGWQIRSENQRKKFDAFITILLQDSCERIVINA
jgi:hypothetical protein